MTTDRLIDSVEKAQEAIVSTTGNVVARLLVMETSLVKVAVANI